MFSQTGSGKLFQKMVETNARNKLQRLNRQRRNRFQEEVTDRSIITIGGIFTYFY